MAFDLATAQGHLSAANQHFAGLLPAPGGPAPAAAAQAADAGRRQQGTHARAYVAAIAGLQQQLGRFAAPPPTSRQQALQQEVAGLQAELSAADALLQETTAAVARWQEKCQQLRAAHEATMTQGLSVSAAGAAVSGLAGGGGS